MKLCDYPWIRGKSIPITLYRASKNRSMSPELIWTNITIGVNVVFEDKLALMTARYILISKRVIVQTKMLLLVR